MKNQRIAVISFPGNNCEVESLRSVKNAGMEAVFFRWNDDTKKIEDCDGYFIPGGFSYEDRGRSGMVAARDPLMGFLREQAAKGKVIIGNCNGAQILVESGLIPLGEGLKMSLGRNVIDGVPAGFLSEWVWITPTCKRERCATSDWEGTMQLPIAHGEGRFTTRDTDLWNELKKNDQIAFSYCDAEGNVSEDATVTPNGSEFAVAAICNPGGNVVALMPHPERTPNGAPYFSSLKRWVGSGPLGGRVGGKGPDPLRWALAIGTPPPTALFIDTIITNTEERTVEQAARRVVLGIRVRQFRYVPLSDDNPGEFLSHLSRFNPHKEIAYIRRGKKLTRWMSESKAEKPLRASQIFEGTMLLRRDAPFEGAGDSGICYVLSGTSEQKIYSREFLEIFANPHASTLQKLL